MYVYINSDQDLYFVQKCLYETITNYYMIHIFPLHLASLPHARRRDRLIVCKQYLKS
jgi:hypothetical protein